MFLSKEEKQTIESYDKFASQYAANYNSSGFWQEAFQVFHQYLPQGRILDLGCGTGRDSKLFDGNVYRHFGIDLSRAMLREAKAFNQQIQVLQMDMHLMAFRPRTFDGFWAAASLLHIRKKNIYYVLNQISLALKPGGIGFIAIKEGEGEKQLEGRFPYDKRLFSLYSTEEFSRIIDGSNFKILATDKMVMSEKLTWLKFFVIKDR